MLDRAPVSIRVTLYATSTGACECALCEGVYAKEFLSQINTRDPMRTEELVRKNYKFMEPDPEPMRKERYVVCARRAPASRPPAGGRCVRGAGAGRKSMRMKVYVRYTYRDMGDSIQHSVWWTGGYTPGDCSEKYRAPSVLLLPKRKTS